MSDANAIPRLGGGLPLEGRLKRDQIRFSSIHDGLSLDRKILATQAASLPGSGFRRLIHYVASPPVGGCAACLSATYSAHDRDGCETANLRVAGSAVFSLYFVRN